MYSSTLSLTSSLDGGMMNATPRQLYPRERDLVPIVMEAGWSKNRSGRVRKISTPTGIRSPDSPAHSEVSFVLYLYLNKPTEMSMCDKGYRTSTVLASRLLLALGVSQQFQWPAVEEEPSARSHGVCPCNCYPTLTWKIA
jgi:hypothetical protein